MIETSNPEIDVAELMQRVRAEAAALKLAREQQPAAASGRRRSLAPARLPAPVAVPEITLPKGVDTKKDRLDQMLQRARHKWEGRRGLQKLWRRLFPRQRPFNHILLEVIAVLTKNDRSLANRIQQLTDCVQAQQQVIRALAKRGDLEAVWMSANGAGNGAGHGASREEFEALQQHLRDLQGQTDRLGMHVLNLENHTRPAAHHVHALQGQTDRLGAHVLHNHRELEAQTEYVRSTQAQADQLGLRINHIELEIGKNTTETRFAQRAIDELAARRAALEQQVMRLEDKHSGDAAFIKAAVAEHSAFIERVLRNGGGAVPSIGNRTDDSSNDADHDAFFASLRERVRGSRAEVKKQCRLYLPFISEARAGSAERPILDLASGRGEWLELLGETKLVARGVEANSAMVASVQELGLEAQHVEPIAHLQSLPSESQGAVTGFHLVEHLTTGELMSLLRETRRVLKPGGVAIFESPNCRNVVVGASTFYADPSRRRPILPETAAFMLESVGFANVQITYHTPEAASAFNRKDKESAVLKELLAGPRLFAVVGHVPAAA